MIGVPDWTEQARGAGDHRGRWPLGLESMGFRMTRHLLPPLTNTTQRARYYSFFAWVYWTFIRRMEAAGRERARYLEQKAWRNRLENALRTATLLDPDYDGGLIGRNSAIPLPFEHNAPYPIARPVEISAWQAEYYKPSWLGLGLGHLEGDIVVLDPVLGVPVAEAFDAAVSAEDAEGSARALLLSDAEAIPAWVIRRLRRALAIRALDSAEAERERLIERLFRLRAGEADAQARSDWRRSLSLTLLLELVRQADGSIRGARQIHGIFATGRLPDGRRFTPPAPLHETLQRWQRYQEREQEKVALYALWHEVLLAIQAGDGYGVTGGSILARIEERAAEAEVLRTWLDDDPLSLTVEAAWHRIQVRLAERGQGHDVLADELASSLLDFERQDQAGAATLLLLVLADGWLAREPELPASISRLHYEAAPSELPLSQIAGEIRKRAQEPLRRVLRHAIEQWVIAQSLRVALEKWASQQDRFFIARDADGYRIVRRQSMVAYLGYDPPRIDSSYAMLRDLALVDGHEGLVLTPAGAALLDAALTFHDEVQASAEQP